MLSVVLRLVPKFSFSFSFAWEFLFWLCLCFLSPVSNAEIDFYWINATQFLPFISFHFPFFLSLFIFNPFHMGLCAPPPHIHLIPWIHTHFQSNKDYQHWIVQRPNRLKLHTASTPCEAAAATEEVVANRSRQSYDLTPKLFNRNRKIHQINCSTISSKRAATTAPAATVAVQPMHIWSQWKSLKNYPTTFGKSIACPAWHHSIHQQFVAKSHWRKSNRNSKRRKMMMTLYCRRRCRSHRLRNRLQFLYTPALGSSANEEKAATKLKPNRFRYDTHTHTFKEEKCRHTAIKIHTLADILIHSITRMP